MRQVNTTPTDHVITFFIKEAELRIMFRAENGHSQLFQGNHFVAKTRLVTTVKVSGKRAHIVITVQAPRGSRVLGITRFAIIDTFCLLGRGLTDSS